MVTNMGQALCQVLKTEVCTLELINTESDKCEENQRKGNSEQGRGRVPPLDHFIDEKAFEYFKEVRKEVRTMYKNTVGSTANAKAVRQSVSEMLEQNQGLGQDRTQEAGMTEGDENGEAARSQSPLDLKVMLQTPFFSVSAMGKALESFK